MKKILIAVLALVLLTSCTGGKTVATVGKEKITQGEFEYFLSSIKMQMNGTELKTDEDWETQEIEGEKAIDVAKRRALDIAVSNAKYSYVPGVAGVKPDEKDKARAEETKKGIIDGWGGEQKYREHLKENNITDSFVDRMCRADANHVKLAESFAEKYPVTEEALKARLEGDESYFKAKHILFLTVNPDTFAPLSAEEATAAKTRADMVYDRLKKGADFDSLMKEYSQDPGLMANPNGYVFKRGSGQMMPEFEQAVISLGLGGKPDDYEHKYAFIKTAYGYHIVTRLPVEVEDVRDELTSEIIEDLVDNQIEDWVKEYKITVTSNEELIKSLK